MHTNIDKRGHVGVCRTLIFKVKGQGHELNLIFFDIPDLDNVWIDTKIEFVSRFQQEVTKVIPVHLYDLDVKVYGRGQKINFSFFLHLRPKNVRIDTKIKYVPRLPPEITKVIQKGVWPWISRSSNEDRIFSIITVGLLDPENIPVRDKIMFLLPICYEST